MEEHNLGPNGGLVFCMESLLVNFEWLEEKLTQLDTHYIIFDCPGQVLLVKTHTVMICRCLPHYKYLFQGGVVHALYLCAGSDRSSAKETRLSTVQREFDRLVLLQVCHNCHSTLHVF